MKLLKSITRPAVLAGAVVAFTAAGCAAMMSAATVSQAVNMFENGQATGGVPLTVDAKGPVAITDGVELQGFAFGTYDVDATANSITMTLVAQLENLQITNYDATTFDRYYFAFDSKVRSASISPMSDPNFSATVEVLRPGTQVTAAGAFVDGLGTDFTFDKGGILVTIGEGTDLTKISENGGSLTVNF